MFIIKDLFWGFSSESASQWNSMNTNILKIGLGFTFILSMSSVKEIRKSTSMCK